MEHRLIYDNFEVKKTLKHEAERTTYLCKSRNKLFVAKLRHSLPVSMNETQVLIMLDHPNIPHFVRFSSSQGLHMVATKYIHGKTLDKFMKKSIFTESQAHHLFKQLASAVFCAHQHRVTHNQIHPGNIIISRDMQRLTLVGWNGAFSQSQQDLQPRSHLDQAPASRENGPGFDLWALGMILSYMLTGVYPSEAQDIFQIFPEPCRVVHPANPVEVREPIQDLLDKLRRLDWYTADQSDFVLTFHPWMWEKFGKVNMRRRRRSGCSKSMNCIADVDSNPNLSCASTSLILFPNFQLSNSEKVPKHKQRAYKSPLVSFM